MDPRGPEKSTRSGTGPPQRHREGTSGCSPNLVTPLGLSRQLFMAQLLPRTANRASELQLSVKMFLQDLKQIFQTTGNTNKPLSGAAVAALHFHRKQDPSWLHGQPLSCKQLSQKLWHSHMFSSYIAGSCYHGGHKTKRSISGFLSLQIQKSVIPKF